MWVLKYSELRTWKSAGVDFKDSEIEFVYKDKIQYVFWRYLRFKTSVELSDWYVYSFSII